MIRRAYDVSLIIEILRYRLTTMNTWYKGRAGEVQVRPRDCAEERVILDVFRVVGEDYVACTIEIADTAGAQSSITEQPVVVSIALRRKAIGTLLEQTHHQINGMTGHRPKGYLFTISHCGYIQTLKSYAIDVRSCIALFRWKPQPALVLLGKSVNEHTASNTQVTYQDSCFSRLPVLAKERGTSVEALVEDDADAPLVASSIITFTLDNFRSHVLTSPNLRWCGEPMESKSLFYLGLPRSLQIGVFVFD